MEYRRVNRRYIETVSLSTDANTINSSRSCTVLVRHSQSTIVGIPKYLRDAVTDTLSETGAHAAGVTGWLRGRSWVSARWPPLSRG
eukprot:2638985-Rhodomonas_salina.1